MIFYFYINFKVSAKFVDWYRRVIIEFCYHGIILSKIIIEKKEKKKKFFVIYIAIGNFCIKKKIVLKISIIAGVLIICVRIL